MRKYLVVTPNKIVHFDSHKEAFNNYETQPKPCGVYEYSMLEGLNNTIVFAVNVKAEFHCNTKSPECFLHLQNMLNANNYREGTR